MSKQVTTIIHLNHYSAQINWGTTTNDLRHRLTIPSAIGYLLGDLPPRYPVPAIPSCLFCDPSLPCQWDE